VTDNPRARATQFDHHSADFAESWRLQYANMRDACPVAHTDTHGGFSVLTRYDDVRAALLTPSVFACGRDLQLDGPGDVVAGGVTIPTNPFRMGMMEMDPPESSRLRKLLVPWFSAAATEANAGHIRDLVTWCLDRVIETGRLDVVDDLANPLPALVTLDLMGLPLENWARYARVLHEAAYREKGSAKGVAWLLGDLLSIVEARRRAPAVITTPVDALIAAEVDGAPLSDAMVVELVFMLLNGGIDTSTALIAHSLRHLSTDRTTRDRLAADPSLIPGAVDEFLRYFTPGTGLARTVRQATVVGGVELHPGERVYLALGSANTDPGQFAAPDQVDIDRADNRHLAFGAGLHRCLGSFLAPLEMTVLLEEVLARLPDLTVDEAGVRPYPSVPLVAGFAAMPAAFTPGPRTGPSASGDAPPARDERVRTRAADLAAADSDAPAVSR
jgi:cytochrome P450